MLTILLFSIAAIHSEYPNNPKSRNLIPVNPVCWHFSLFLSLFHVFTGTFQVELIAYNFSSSEENFVEDLQVLRKSTKMLTDQSLSSFVVECWNFAHCIAPNHADLLHSVD